ncbi:endo-1,3-alpha-glucanase family glycosylhydrolase [Paraburkholderia sediminicola]|uniref:Endo-1,3-alpha-glucanase family glycosylhydrolase n=1 Tax=Paraburkholderia rhynchosiae TaxID=487049 RepID=A0ACC7N604_9BURK
MGSGISVRRAVVSLELALVLSMAQSAAQCATDLTSEQWRALQADAQSLVDAESPPTVWPFAITAAVGGGSGLRPHVFAHYLTPFPLSLDNLPAASDYYCTQYLSPNGEKNKFLSVGGYLRDRPIPLTPYDFKTYKERALAVEMLRARTIGIDGFGVDLMQLNQGTQWDDVMRLYSVAEKATPNFAILAEPDMSALAGASAKEMVAAIRVIAGKKSAFRVADGSLAIAPFYAENVSPSFWSEVVQGAAAAGVQVTLIPILLNPSKASGLRSIANTFSFWGVRTPSESIGKGGWENQALATIESLGADVMIPVAPQDARPKDSMFWEARNSELVRDQWSQVLASNPAYVQLVTWNDYSESTHTSPSAGTAFAFYDLAAYYIEWARSGEAPPITRDTIIYFHRRQLFSPGRSSAPETPVVKMGEGPVFNEIEMIGFLTASATMRITVGGAEYTSSGNAGLNVFRVPAVVGTPTFSIIRDGASVAQVASTHSIVAVGNVQDPLYVGGSSARTPMGLVCVR